MSEEVLRQIIGAALRLERPLTISFSVDDEMTEAIKVMGGRAHVSLYNCNGDMYAIESARYVTGHLTVEAQKRSRPVTKEEATSLRSSATVHAPKSYSYLSVQP